MKSFLRTVDPTVFISLKSKNITSLNDLSGKTIASIGAQKTIMKIILQKNGFNHRNSEFIPKKYGINSLYDENEDLLWGVSINELIEIQSNNLDVNILYPKDYGFESQYNVIFTTKELVKKNPELVFSFVQATLKGWQYVLDNPTKSQNFVFEYDSGLNVRHQEFMFIESLNYINPEKSVELGTMTKEKWQKLYNELESINEIEQSFNVEEMLTNEFIIKE